MSGSGYTHFIGVAVPEDIADTIRTCRAWMADRYGCSSGHRTAPHITLVAPFPFGDPRGVRILEDALSRWIAEQRPFECRISGFGAFAERTVFAHVVPGPEWDVWHDGVSRAVNAACPGILPSDRKKFTPHLTVANRDIPSGAVAPALEHFAGLDLDETFTVDHAALFEWVNGSWVIRGQAECAR